MADIGSPGSATYAYTLTGIGEMMDVLPDNTGNLISASDVRNVVFSLYNDIQAGSFSEFLYTDTPATTTVGGIKFGTPFASMSLFTLFNRMFHPDISPSATLTLDPNTSPLDYKSNQSQEPNRKLTWTAQKGTYALNTLGTITRTTNNVVTTIANLGISPDGNSGDLTEVVVPINLSSTWKFSIQDTRTPTALTDDDSVSVSYAHRMYWGRFSERRDLTSDEIRSLTGGGKGVIGSSQYNSGSFLSLSFGGTNVAKISFPRIDGANSYLVWAFPSTFGTPTFYINGLQSGAITPVIKNKTYVNSFNYEVEYDIYCTLVPYPTPVDIELR